MSRPIIRSPIRACARPVIRPTDRVNGAVVQVGQAVYANGQIWECVFPGTLAGAEPTIIAPLGASDSIIDGTFDAALGVNWTNTGTWTIAGGKAVSGGTGELDQPNTEMVAGDAFLAEFDVSNRTVGSVNVQMWSTGAMPVTGSVDAHYAGIGTVGANTFQNARIIAVSSFDGSVDNLTITQVTQDGTAAWKTIG